MKKFSEFCADQKLPTVDEVYISSDGFDYEMLKESKWIPGRFNSNIRIDHPTHGVGQTHAHVYGRKGNEIGVVNFDGTASHGTRMKLTDKDAEALRARGFSVPTDNIIEWCVSAQSSQVLLG